MLIGTRAVQGWGEGPERSRLAVGDVVYLPPECPAVQGDRADPGLHRVEAVFSIDDDPSFYYRLSPTRIVEGRRLVTDWHHVSDRIHVIPGRCDFTEGFVVLYESAPASSDAVPNLTPPPGPVARDRA